MLDTHLDDLHRIIVVSSYETHSMSTSSPFNLYILIHDGVLHSRTKKNTQHK